MGVEGDPRPLLGGFWGMRGSQHQGTVAAGLRARGTSFQCR